MRYGKKDYKLQQELDEINNSQLWVDSAPSILERMTHVIKYHPCRNTKHWIDIALPELRNLYVVVRKLTAKKDYSNAIGNVLKMCNVINAYNNDTNIVLYCRGNSSGFGSRYITEYILYFSIAGKIMSMEEALQRIKESYEK